MRRAAVTTALALLGIVPLLATGCKSSSNHEREENEQEVTLDQVPQVVRDTFTRESGGAPMGTVKREQEKGKTLYEVRITKGAKTVEVEVDEAGNVVRRRDVK
jgi:hypothetical protein